MREKSCLVTNLKKYLLLQTFYDFLCMLNIVTLMTTRFVLRCRSFQYGLKPPRPHRMWWPRLCPLALAVRSAGIWCSDHLPLLLATCWVREVQFSLGAMALERLSARGVAGRKTI